ncbi:uncharacterized protein BO80DRAFT_243456 [Aspergillus ibericus CBS 121593]|uniref:Uncharacterized protein n=1 Tax=Aspergillus ibericus CBS 121593 TaxID=1448316 RepID=A0A395GKJ9_9EURO|nr:hypothetical protein BO80DRAFT_243456 [Aspergillus ibericus CBS 121593]RAK96021.1 hypothetical protein BO80DRAFT_243456 [Aspergillus ibericus CBS 121593]
MNILYHPPYFPTASVNWNHFDPSVFILFVSRLMTDPACVLTHPLPPAPWSERPNRPPPRNLWKRPTVFLRCSTELHSGCLTHLHKTTVKVDYYSPLSRHLARYRR